MHMHMEQVENYEKMKLTRSSGIFKTIYHNGSYLLLFGKDIYKDLKFHLNDSSYFEIRTSLI